MRTRFSASSTMLFTFVAIPCTASEVALSDPRAAFRAAAAVCRLASSLGRRNLLASPLFVRAPARLLAMPREVSHAAPPKPVFRRDPALDSLPPAAVGSRGSSGCGGCLLLLGPGEAPPPASASRAASAFSTRASAASSSLRSAVSSSGYRQSLFTGRIRHEDRRRSPSPCL